MEPVVEGAAGAVRLKNYHGRCKAKDASLHTMNNITAESNSTARCFHETVQNKATAYDGAIFLRVQSELQTLKALIKSSGFDCKQHQIFA